MITVKKKATKLIIHVDGGSRGNPGPGGYAACLRLIDGDESIVRNVGGRLGHCTNNYAEHQAMMLGLSYAIALVMMREDISEIEVYSDSELVVNQVTGRWQVKHDDLKEACAASRTYIGEIGKRGVKLSINAIRREQNSEADSLVNRYMDGKG